MTWKFSNNFRFHNRSERLLYVWSEEFCFDMTSEFLVGIPVSIDITESIMCCAGKLWSSPSAPREAAASAYEMCYQQPQPVENKTPAVWFISLAVFTMTGQADQEKLPTFRQFHISRINCSRWAGMDGVMGKWNRDCQVNIPTNSSSSAANGRWKWKGSSWVKSVLESWYCIVYLKVGPNIWEMFTWCNEGVGSGSEYLPVCFRPPSLTSHPVSQ